MPNRSENGVESIGPAVEVEVARYVAAREHGDAGSLATIEKRVLEICGATRVIATLLAIAGRYRAERVLLDAALEKKSQVLDSLLTAPRRVARVLGLVYEEDETGQRVAWAILQGPPSQAVRFHAGVSPQDICENHPEEPVWVWLAESVDSLVVLGRIEAPPLLQAGIEREMVFEGLVETEGETDVR
jgi:hypothetical protein